MVLQPVNDSIHGFYLHHDHQFLLKNKIQEDVIEKNIGE